MPSAPIRNFMLQQGFAEEPSDACDMHFVGLYFQPWIVFPSVLLAIGVAKGIEAGKFQPLAERGRGHLPPGPPGGHLAGPVHALGVEMVLVLVAEMAALVVQLERQRPRAQGGGAVESHHPVAADHGALGVADAEAGVHLGAESEGHRPLAPAEGENRNILPQGDLRFTLGPELAVASAGGEEPAHQPVHPGRGLGQLLAHVGRHQPQHLLSIWQAQCFSALLADQDVAGKDLFE